MTYNLGGQKPKYGLASNLVSHSHIKSQDHATGSKHLLLRMITGTMSILDTHNDWEGNFSRVNLEVKT